MKTHSDEAIISKIEQIWASDHSKFDDFKIELLKNKPKYVEVKLSRMYEAPGLSLSHLLAVSKFFETQNITDPEHFSLGGCESCDYGSSYGFTLVIQPEEKK